MFGMSLKTTVYWWAFVLLTTVGLVLTTFGSGGLAYVGLTVTVGVVLIAFIYAFVVSAVRDNRRRKSKHIF